jgi:Tfp pilus assembly protein PilF
MITKTVVALIALFPVNAAIAQDLATKIDQGRSQRINGNAAQSVATLQPVLAQDPSNFRAQYNLALALAETDPKAAESAFEKAEQLGESQGLPDPTIYNSYGWMLNQEGKYAAAEQQFNKGMQHFEALSDSSKQRLLNNLGLLYLQTGRLDQAQQQFTRSAAQFNSDGAKRSLDIISSIKKTATNSPASASSGLLYLGQTRADGSAWAGDRTTDAASPASLAPGQTLKLQQAATIHSEVKSGDASVPGKSIGVYNAGDVVKVINVRQSVAPDGSKYVWAMTKKDDGS